MFPLVFEKKNVNSEIETLGELPVTDVLTLSHFNCSSIGTVQQEFAMLSLASGIVRHDIQAVGRLSHNHPVFLLAGHHDDQIAIKLQSQVAIGANRLQRNFEVMAIVNPSAKQVLLTINEVQQLRVWASAELLQTDDQQKRLLLSDFHQELNRPSHSNAWLKMEVKKLETLADAVGSQEGDRDKAKVKAFSKALVANGGLEKLGEIVAADLFNNNGDRISYAVDRGTNKLPDGGGGDKYGNIRLQHLFNLGNIMLEFDKQGKNAKPIGLDSYDANSDFNKWKMPLAQAEHGSTTFWSGRILARINKKQLEEFATKVIADFEAVLGKRHRKIPFATKLRLGKNASQRFLLGLETGITKILKEIRQYYGVLGRVMPQGMVDRLHLLGR